MPTHSYVWVGLSIRVFRIDSDEAQKEDKSSVKHACQKPFTENHRINHKNSYENRNVTWGDKISKGLKGRKITWEQGNVGQPSSPVNQYDLKGNFIKKWDSIKEPSLIYKCYVSGCLRGRQKSAGGYIWKYLSPASWKKEIL